MGDSMIPDSIAEVTPGWLGDVLGAEVQGMDIKQIGQGVGLMGDIFCVQLSGQGPNLPASVVVKLPSSFEENRAQGISLGMFEAEIRFYHELAPKVPTGLPKIYHGEIESGTASFVIVMEDLTSMAMVDQYKGMNLEQARAAVHVLANIHAVWWDSVQQDDMAWIPAMTAERIELLDPLLVQTLPVFVDNFGSYLPEGGFDLYKNFAGNYLKINQRLSARSPWTLAHQDYRVENMLFGPKGSDKVVVLDWQGIGRGPGSYDLAYLLGGSMDTELRRQHEAELLLSYHTELLAAGVSGYSLEQLQEDYAFSHLQGGLATSLVTGGAMDLSNERGVELIATMARRHSQAALDHNGLAQLEDIAGSK